nr:hypothetical protein [Tanacetum cinerariifolium]
MASSSIPHIDYAPTVHQHSELSSPETGLVVLVFQKGDDLIDSINHMMSFLTAVITSRGSGKQRVIVCYNCKGDGHMSKQCTKPKRKQDAEWFKDKYMNESQYNTVQNSNLPALQDDLILSVIEQLKTQVVNYTKINHDNKQVNELLTAELERYKNQERVLKEQQNNDKASVSYEQSLEIETLKHTLSDHLKEKGSLEQKITLLKNDFQKEEFCNIDRELALEKQVKELNNIVFKRNQSAQTVHIVIEKSNAIVVYDSEETLLLAEESRSKMIEKQKDPKMAEQKVITKPIDYAVLNQLSKDFKTRFVPQTELSGEQAFWSRYSVPPEEPNLSASTTIVEVPKEIPNVSLVNSSLKKLKFHLASFDMVVKERTTTIAITEGTWGFEHTKACFRDDIIPFVKALKELFNSFDQFFIDELSEVQQVFKQMEQAVKQHSVEKNKF